MVEANRHEEFCLCEVADDLIQTILYARANPWEIEELRIERDPGCFDVSVQVGPFSTFSSPV